MAPNSPKPVVFDRTMVVLKEHVFSFVFWLALYTSIAGLLVVIKYLQYGWESPFGFSSSGWYVAFHNRLDDVSFMLLTAACFTGFCLVWPVHRMLGSGMLPEGNVRLTRKHVSWLVVILLLNWALYFQAVYRDGGTFLWSHGDGREVLADAWAEAMRAPPADRDRLGPIFPAAGAGGSLADDERREAAFLRSRSDNDGFTSLSSADQNRFVALAARQGRCLYGQMAPAQSAELLTAARHAKRLAGLQAVEGIVFLFVFALWAVIGVLVNVYVSLFGRLEATETKSPRARACNSLFRACLVPALLLGVFAVLGVATDWHTGIDDAFLAGLSAAGLWLPVIVAVVRLLRNCGYVLTVPFLAGKD